MCADSTLHAPDVSGFDPHSSNSFNYRTLFGDGDHNVWKAINAPDASREMQPPSRIHVGLATPESNVGRKLTPSGRFRAHGTNDIEDLELDAIDEFGRLLDTAPTHDRRGHHSPHNAQRRDPFDGRRRAGRPSGKKKSGGGGGLLIVLLIVGGIGAGVWVSNQEEQQRRQDVAYRNLDFENADRLRDFLVRFPDSEHADRIRDALEQLTEVQFAEREFRALVASPTESAAEAYVERYRRSPWASHARRIAAWCRAVDRGSLEIPYRAILDTGGTYDPLLVTAARNLLDNHFYERFGHRAAGASVTGMPDALPGRVLLINAPQEDAPVHVELEGSQAVVSGGTPYTSPFPVTLVADEYPRLPDNVQARFVREARVVMLRRLEVVGEPLARRSAPDHMKLSVTVTWTAVDMIADEVLGRWRMDFPAPDGLSSESRSRHVYRGPDRTFMLQRYGHASGTVWVPEFVSEETNMGRYLRIR